MTAPGRGTADTAAIRPATPNDLAAIVAIERTAFSDPWSRSGFADLVDRPGVVFLVAELDGHVAGYAVAYHAADEAELANLAVADAWRRRGVAQHLLDAVIAAVRAGGAADLWLEVRASNAAARTLYGAYGFLEAGVRRRYYDRPVEDAIVMRRHTGRR